MIDAKETYQLLPSQHVEAEATDRLSRHDAVFTDRDDSAVEGHSYEKLDHVEEHAYSVRRDSPPRWKRSPRSRVLAGVLSGLLFLCLLVAALSHPAPRETVRGAWHRMPFNKPTKQDLMALMPRVERNSSVSMKDYLAARFDPDDTTVMWTMATGAAPSYIPAARNWDLKRAELGMNDSVVVLCLDHACLDECERSGLRAHAAYLKDDSVIPPPSQRSRLAKRSGAERGHVLAYLKFKAMLDMAKSGYYSLFFEGDTFLTADPFDHMLSRQNTTWDLQFTEDWGYLLNFGFVHLRPSNATIAFFQLAYDKYIRHNQWDQELLSNLVTTLGTREVGRSRGVRGFAGDFDKEHWWLCDQIGLRLYMLPLHKFWATHIAAVEEYSLPDDVPEPVMNHLSAVTFANRQFYAKERGWAMDVDGFYTTPRPILRASTIWANYRAVAHYGRLVHVLAVKMGWALQVPKEITITGTERDGRRWIYVREWSRLISVQTAVTFNLDLLEANFFEHAERYAPNKTLTQWQNRRDVVDLSQFASLEEVITHLKSLNVAPAEGRVIELVGYDSANSTASKWPLLVRSTRGVPKHWREIRMCKHFHQQHFPYEWCTPLPLAWA